MSGNGASTLWTSVRNHLHAGQINTGEDDKPDDEMHPRGLVDASIFADAIHPSSNEFAFLFGLILIGFLLFFCIMRNSKAINAARTEFVRAVATKPITEDNWEEFRAL